MEKILETYITLLIVTISRERTNIGVIAEGDNQRLRQFDILSFNFLIKRINY